MEKRYKEHLTLFLSEWISRTFFVSAVENNERGECIHYSPVLLQDFEFDQMVQCVNRKVGEKFKNNVKSELDFLKKEVTLKELEKFNREHPFWKKERFNLLREYNNLYKEFFEKFNKRKRGSKNIVSTNRKTCISTIQLIDKTLCVFQRSCDLSLGLFADTLTIDLIKKGCGAKKVYWLIGCPHVYTVNFEATKKYFSSFTEDRPKFSFCVRKNCGKGV